MECIMGLATKDQVLLAADAHAGRSILTMKHDAVKIWEVGARSAMCVVGESGDPSQFSEYVARNLHLNRLRQNRELETFEVAHFIRKQLADYLRSQTPYFVNVLVGGWDEPAASANADGSVAGTGGPQLYWLDYLAAMTRVPYAVHGYSSHLALSTFDHGYRPDLSPEEALDLLRTALSQVGRRFVIGLPRYKVVRLTREGIQQLDDIVLAAPVSASVPKAAPPVLHK